MMLHIGRKVPKGFRELPGGIHLGRGVWLLPMTPDPPLKVIEPEEKQHEQTGPIGLPDG